MATTTTKTSKVDATDKELSAYGTARSTIQENLSAPTLCRRSTPTGGRAIT